jgi:short-subunit dehydrogenase
MDKKICLITGATAGIGKETARQLAARNIHVVFTARNKQKASDTINEIKNAVEGASLDYLLCDLSSQKSIRNMADEFRSSYNRLDMLINNAGAVYGELQYSEDGIEMQWAVKLRQESSMYRLTHITGVISTLTICTISRNIGRCRCMLSQSWPTYCLPMN